LNQNVGFRRLQKASTAAGMRAHPPQSPHARPPPWLPPPSPPAQIRHPYVPVDYNAITGFFNTTFLVNARNTMLELIGQMLPVTLPADEGTPGSEGGAGGGGGPRRALLFLGSPRCGSLSEMQVRLRLAARAAKAMLHALLLRRPAVSMQKPHGRDAGRSRACRRLGALP
jgi:hypothetical protein